MNNKNPATGVNQNLHAYPNVRRENIRYRDTDRQGHVNNAVFSTFYECSRVAVLFDPERDLVSPQRQFVIARSEIDFLAEVTWPGHVDIGICITRVGTSSIVAEQAIFQNGVCASTARSIMVLMDTTTRKSTPLPEHILQSIADLKVVS